MLHEATAGEVDLALSRVGAKEVELLRQSSMSNSDRLEAAYRSYAAKKAGISRDEFIGLLLGGKVSTSGTESVASEIMGSITEIS